MRHGSIPSRQINNVNKLQWHGYYGHFWSKPHRDGYNFRHRVQETPVLTIGMTVALFAVILILAFFRRNPNLVVGVLAGCLGTIFIFLLATKSFENSPKFI